jgi:hypothetical protein
MKNYLQEQKALSFEKITPLQVLRDLLAITQLRKKRMNELLLKVSLF